MVESLAQASEDFAVHKFEIVDWRCMKHECRGDHLTTGNALHSRQYYSRKLLEVVISLELLRVGTQMTAE